MARLARLVLPAVPYHVTQRGNRRQPTFFEDGDFALYRDLLAEGARRAGASVWAYCLMPNHVHVIIVPADPDGLRATFAYAHRRYTGFINARHRWTGHLWQGRFGAVAMDGQHLAAAARYVAIIPVRARLVSQAEEWEWSSVRAHLAGRDDGLVTVAPLIERLGQFRASWRGGGSAGDTGATPRRNDRTASRQRGLAHGTRANDGPDTAAA